MQHRHDIAFAERLIERDPQFRNDALGDGADGCRMFCAEVQFCRRREVLLHGAVAEGAGLDAGLPELLGAEADALVDFFGGGRFGNGFGIFGAAGRRDEGKTRKKDVFFHGENFFDLWLLFNGYPKATSYESRAMSLFIR